MKAHWQAWFALGVIRFGLRPEDFWALTPGEWLALVKSLEAGRTRPPERERIEALRAQFPDSREAPDGPR